METGSDGVFEETDSKILIRGKPLGLAIITGGWIFSGLLGIVIGVNQLEKSLEVNEGNLFGMYSYITLFGFAAVVLGVSLVLIGIGLWQTRFGARLIAMTIYAIILIYYIGWTIVGFWNDITGVQLGGADVFITRWIESISMHLGLAILIAISFIYLQINDYWF